MNTTGRGNRLSSTTVPIRIPNDLLAALREAAAADERTVASLIRLAIRRELERRGNR